MQGLIGTPWQRAVRRPAMIRVHPRESGGDDCRAQIGFVLTHPLRTSTNHSCAAGIGNTVTFMNRS